MHSSFMFVHTTVELKLSKVACMDGTVRTIHHSSCHTSISCWIILFWSTTFPPTASGGCFPFARLTGAGLGDAWASFGGERGCSGFFFGLALDFAALLDSWISASVALFRLETVDWTKRVQHKNDTPHMFGSYYLKLRFRLSVLQTSTCHLLLRWMIQDINPTQLRIIILGWIWFAPHQLHHQDKNQPGPLERPP